MGNCRSRSRRVDSYAKLIAKHQDTERKIFEISQELHQAMHQLGSIDSKIEDLQFALQEKGDSAAIGERIKYVDRGESPIETEVLFPAYLTGVTRKIYKMELSYSDRKRRSILQRKLQSARDRAKEERRSSRAGGDRLFGTNLTSFLTNSSFSSNDQDGYSKSYISTPEMFGRAAKADNNEINVKAEYVEHPSLYPSFNTKDFNNVDSILHQNESLFHEENLLNSKGLNFESKDQSSNSYSSDLIMSLETPSI